MRTGGETRSAAHNGRDVETPTSARRRELLEETDRDIAVHNGKPPVHAPPRQPGRPLQNAGHLHAEAHDGERDRNPARPQRPGSDRAEVETPPCGDLGRGTGPPRSCSPPTSTPSSTSTPSANRFGEPAATSRIATSSAANQERSGAGTGSASQNAGFDGPPGAPSRRTPTASEPILRIRVAATVVASLIACRARRHGTEHRPRGPRRARSPCARCRHRGALDPLSAASASRAFRTPNGVPAA